MSAYTQLCIVNFGHLLIADLGGVILLARELQITLLRRPTDIWCSGARRCSWTRSHFGSMSECDCTSTEALATYRCTIGIALSICKDCKDSGTYNGLVTRAAGGFELVLVSVSGTGVLGV